MYTLVGSCKLFRRLLELDALDVLLDVGLRHVEVAATEDADGHGARFASCGLEIGLVRATATVTGESNPRALDGRLLIAQLLGTRVVRLVVDRCPVDKKQVAVFQQVGERADELKLTIALEIAAPGITSREMVATIRAINRPAVGLSFDTGGYWLQNPGAAVDVALDRISPWLAALRLRDHTGAPHDRYCPPLGSGGLIDLARTLEVVRALRFAGPVVVDFDLVDEWLGPEQIRQGLTQCMDQLRHSGWCDWPAFPTTPSED